MKRPVSCVFHVHTRHSFDCISSPSKAVAWAQRHEIDVLGITDHDTIQGAVEAASRGPSSGVQVIIGAEYATNHGDIIGLFLTEEISTREAFDVIDAIRAQGGISLLPHPYHGHRSIDKLAQAVDLIEVFNARCSAEQNRRASDLAKAQSKPTIGGADAHFIQDLGNCVTYLETTRPVTPESVLSAGRTWTTRPSSTTGLYWSQIIKGVKTRNRGLVTAYLRALVAFHIKRTAGEQGYEKLRHAWKRQG